MIGFGLLNGALSLVSVMVHVVNLKEADLFNVTGLLHHIPLAVAGVMTAVIFFFPDRVGYAISFVTLLCIHVIYWRWHSWSLGTRGPESLASVISEQYPIGASIFTRGLLILLVTLFLYESAVLIKVLLSWRRS